MFAVEERDRVRDHVLALAEADPRVVAAAQIGSLALGEGDRWSDLDLTFGVAEGALLSEVMDDWSRRLAEDLGAVVLLDLARGDLVYRVFLLADWLQVDLSFAPGTTRQLGPRFASIFGPHSREEPAPASVRDLLGWAVVYARHAMVTVERGHWWQSEYCIGSVRDRALDIACLRRGLPAGSGRGFDQLPAEVRDRFEGALVASLDREELLRALAVAVEALLREAGDDVDAHVAAQLRGLTA